MIGFVITGYIINIIIQIKIRIPVIKDFGTVIL